ncbi:hypothetical protein B1R27_00695 [Streptomyces sp. GKU 895]|nr:hypothetical protein B1R27_00695 [Streptomyces sp. GKU 895]
MIVFLVWFLRRPRSAPARTAPSGRVRRVWRVAAELLAVAVVPGGQIEQVRAGGPASLTGYARELYGILRELDQQGCDLSVASLPVGERLGLATANRRAAGPRLTGTSPDGGAVGPDVSRARCLSGRAVLLRAGDPSRQVSGLAPGQATQPRRCGQDAAGTASSRPRAVTSCALPSARL